MYALISMGLALVFLVVLLRLKVKLGRSMFLASIAVAVLLGVRPGALWETVVREWNDEPLGRTTGYLFVTLTALVTLVNVLGAVMRETGVSGRLAWALQGLFKSRRVALAAIPMMMGLLPTPGGIMLSAPMVRDLGDHIGMDRSHAAAINFFFRHQWETIWPLFPAVPLIQVMLGVSAFRLISHNVAIMLMGTVGGVVFLLLFGIPPRNVEGGRKSRFIDDARDFGHAFWPIVLVAVLYAGFNLPPAGGLVPAVLLFLVLHKVPVLRWWGIVKPGFKADIVVLIFGALLFKLNLEAGGAVGSAVGFLSDANVPPGLLIFFLPMLVGSLTGLTLGTVAITFPFLIPFIGVGSEAKLGLETLAFSGLVCGLLLTPVHLCMALSASYFETPLRKIIIRLFGPLLFVAGAGVLMAVVFG